MKISTKTKTISIAETPNWLRKFQVSINPEGWYDMMCKPGISQLTCTQYIIYLALALSTSLSHSVIFICQLNIKDSRQNLLNCKRHNTRIILGCTGCQLSENGTVMKSAKRGEVTVTQLGYNRFWLFAIRQDCLPVICAHRFSVNIRINETRDKKQIVATPEAPHFIPVTHSVSRQSFELVHLWGFQAC